MRRDYPARINTPVPAADRGIFLARFFADLFNGKIGRAQNGAAKKETRHEAGFQRTGTELLQAGA
jgi:hypothetical protein